MTSGSRTAKGSFPMMSRAHQTAWPRPSGFCWRVKLAPPAGRRLCSTCLEDGVFLLGDEGVFQFVGMVEIVFDGAFVAPGDKNDVLDARLERLIDHILDGGAVDDRKHFLRDRFRCRQHTCAKPGDRQDCLSYAHFKSHFSCVR
jgi:hypothetical protein